MKCTPKNQGSITTESTPVLNQDTPQSNSLLSLSSQSKKAVLFGTLLILALMSLFSCRDANAELAIDERTALRIVLAEAEGEPQIGRIAIGEVLRQRNSVKPFCGFKAVTYRNGAFYRGNRKIDDITVGQALKAWRESERTNYTKKATHFENVKAFGVPYWAHQMEETCRIGNHVFYREVRK